MSTGYDPAPIEERTLAGALKACITQLRRDSDPSAHPTSLVGIRRLAAEAEKILNAHLARTSG